LNVRRLLTALLIGLPITLIGCAKPNKANIELRKKNAELRDKVEMLERQHAGDVASIAAMQKPGTTLPSLSNERLGELFTVHGISFGRLTGIDPDQKGLKAYVVPTDGAGEPLKAAGSFVIDAFDLSRKEDGAIGHWEFPLDQAGKIWFGKATLYTYVLSLPTEKLPQRGEVTLKVTFTDALTGREFSGQRVVKIP
jgi:hypothetical protein